MRNRQTSGIPNIPRDAFTKAGFSPDMVNHFQRSVETSRGWTLIPIPLNDFMVTGTGDPALGIVNSSNWMGRSFTAEGTEGNEKRLIAQVIVPHSVRRGSNLEFIINCCTSATNPSDDTVLWELQHGTLNNTGEVLSAATMTTVLSEMPLQNWTNDYVYLTQRIATRIDEDVKEGSLIGLHLRRKSSTATDNYAGTIILLSAGVLCFAEKTGTVESIPR